MANSLSVTTTTWFSQCVGTPTPVQRETWEAVAGGNHVLAVAPTGSGKTLAAFLVALEKLYSGGMKPGALRILYISPLKALGTDIRENLTGPLRELKEAFGAHAPEIRIGIRNGDTTPSERRRQITKPPEILVSTPESLCVDKRTQISQPECSGCCG